MLLQQLFSDPQTSFRSTEQLKLATWVVQPENDMLAIMGTGEGKSIAWEISGLLCQGTRKFTLVILPFKAIIVDAMQRAQSHGLSCKVFKAEDYPNHNYNSIAKLDILFAVAESLQTGAWYRCVT